MVKVICAGYPKTGTKSLTKALFKLGYNNVHDYLEHIDFYMDEYEKYFEKGHPISHVLDKYDELNVDCTVDMPPSFLFEEFHQRWPDAKIILTIRDEDAWYKSIKKMNDIVFNWYHWMTYFSKNALRFETFMRKLYQYMLGSGLESPWLWKMHYRRHNAYVAKVIPPENLLVFDVSNGWEPLCKFLGKKIPDEPFPFENAAGSKNNIVQRLLTESKIASRAKFEIIISILSYLVVFGGIVLAYLNFFS
ncbi:uncharacterized protein LOC143462484 [Clavelina lepadiformis]|uniref:Sulfotransferase n=1 Tax=Clavelina lepadiformis TaxID=159417 RepID=A0ABP0GLG4_CLALP